MLISSSIRLDGEEPRYELDSTEIIPSDPLFELDDTSVDIPSLMEPVLAADVTAELSPRSPTEDLTNHLEPSTDSSVGDHLTFETPDDVGADLSPSPSVKARSSMIGLGDDLVERPTISSTRKLPPHIFLSTNSDVIWPLNTHAGHDSAIGISHQHLPRSVPPLGLIEHGQVPRYTYTADQELPGIESAENEDGPSSTKRIIEEITQRRHRTAARERFPGRFQPSMLPNLEVLTLTDIPSTTRREDLINSLTMFIQECAEEEELAELEVLEFQESNGQFSSGGQNTSGVLKLRRLILEMSPAPDPILPFRSPREKRHSFTKSSTEDADSEMFMEATETDFSFFGEDDGGLLVSEGKIDAPAIINDGMIYMNSPAADGHLVDVISEIVSFRREKRMRYEAAVRVGTSKLDIALSGHWRGEITVVRTSMLHES
jgi:hypothetical protein